MTNTLTVNSLICGRLTQETILNIQGEISVNRCGGNLLYTAYGYNLWRQGVGLASKVGENFPEEWLAAIPSDRFDTSGILRLYKISTCVLFMHSSTRMITARIILRNILANWVCRSLRYC
jgi:hypothetical protein